MLTTSDDAASDDAVDGAACNADREQEYQFGSITTDVAFSSQNQVDGDFILSTYSVANTNDSGASFFRQANLDANADPGVDTVYSVLRLATQAIVAVNWGFFTVSATSSLPTITEVVIIDATTRLQYATSPVTELNRSTSGAGSDGVTITGGASTIKGLAINGFADLPLKSLWWAHQMLFLHLSPWGAW